MKVDSGNWAIGLGIMVLLILGVAVAASQDKPKLDEGIIWDCPSEEVQTLRFECGLPAPGFCSDGAKRLNERETLYCESLDKCTVTARVDAPHVHEWTSSGFFLRRVGEWAIELEICKADGMLRVPLERQKGQEKKK